MCVCLKQKPKKRCQVSCSGELLLLLLLKYFYDEMTPKSRRRSRRRRNERQTTTQQFFKPSVDTGSDASPQRRRSPRRRRPCRMIRDRIIITTPSLLSFLSFLSFFCSSSPCPDCLPQQQQHETRRILLPSFLPSLPLHHQVMKAKKRLLLSFVVEC